MPRRKVQQLVEEAKQLPYGERAELIEQLIAASAQERCHACVASFNRPHAVTPRGISPLALSTSTSPTASGFSP